MKSFSTILAIAVLAYTANAGAYKARCKIEDSATGDINGHVHLVQQFDSETGETDTAQINFGVRGLEGDADYSFDLKSGSCDGSLVKNLYQGTTWRGGAAMARGVEDDSLEIDESYAGQFAAFSQNGAVVQCCELEYKECSRDRPPQPDGDDQERPPRPDDDEERPPRPDDDENRPPRPEGRRGRN